MSNFYSEYPVEGGGGVTSLNGETGALTLVAGTGISISILGDDITITNANPDTPVTLGTANGLSLIGQQLSLGLSSVSTNGALSSADWTTFNSKQAALGFTPENVANKGIANGYAPLDAGNKVPVAYLPNSVMTYLGTQDAATNTPTLADGTGDAGDVYICNVAGTVNFGSGPITFADSDWVVYSGSVWQKSINSNAVASVNGFTGAVVLTTTDISEGTNEYFTDARARTAVLNTVTNGGLYFGNGTNASQDATNLFWDDSNDRLGIGTNTPTNALNIQKSLSGVSLAAIVQNTSATANADAHLRLTTAIGGGNAHIITSYDSNYWSFGQNQADNTFKIAPAIDLTTNTALTITNTGVLNVPALTASRALVTDASKNIAVSTTTSTELGYVSGVTSAIQTQLNSKFALPALTAGSVLFSDGTTIAQDNTNLNFNDATNVLSVPTVKDPASSIALSLTSGTLSNSSAQTTVDFQNRQLTEGTFIAATWSSVGLDLHDSVNGSNRNVSNVANITLGSNGISYAVQSSTRQTSVPGSGGTSTINMSTRYAAIVHYSAKDSAGGGYNKTGTLHIAKEQVGNNTNAAITDTGAATNANMDLLTFSINGSGDLLTTNGTSVTLTINFMITYL